MVAGLWALEDVHDLAGFVDQERRALQAHIGLAVVLLLAPDAVLADDLVVRVSDQRKGSRVWSRTSHGWRCHRATRQ